jgi:DNA-binding winged helix-turn-helix (wHTH) protein/Tol biopolymer transport system component
VPKPSYEFANFRIDGDLCALLQDGRTVPLTPKAFDTLLLLVENRGRLLEKELMMQRLWPDAVVEEANLANNISLLRKVLGDRADAIQTVPRRGYRFVGDVRVIGEAPPPPPDVAPPPVASHRYFFAIAAAVVALILGLLAGRRLWKHGPPSFEQITFRRGLLWGARIAPDGETIVFSGEYDKRPPELFVVRGDHPESRPLGVEACLLAISKSGDLAVSLKSKLLGFVRVGTLARLPITGGAPREIADNVQEADWAPDGSLAVIRWDFPIIRIEYPIGHVLYKAPQPIWMSCLRVSPDGSRVAFLLHETERFDDRGRAVVMDRSGKIISSSRVFPSANGLVWRPSGKELWITATPDAANNGIFSIDANGHDRPLALIPGRLTLYDATPSGVALAAREDSRAGIVVMAPGDTHERDLSWLDGSWMRDISDDGSTILFDEESTGGGATAHTYIRPTDGGPAVNLSEGHAIALSHDGSHVLIRQRFTNPPRLLIVPTGAGQSTVLRTGNVEAAERAWWLPDGSAIVFAGNEKGHKRRMFLADLRTNAIRPITPEGAALGVLTPDGVYVAAKNPGERYLLYPIAGGAPRALPGVDVHDYAARFSSDGKSLYVERFPDNAIERIDLATGDREHVATFGEKMPPGILYASPATVAANGRAYAYTYLASEADLYIIDDLR